VDLAPGLTYLFQGESWSGGAQAIATLRTGENDHGYRLGHRFLATGWVARRLSRRFSVSARLAGESWGDIIGSDPAFAMARTIRMVPTVFPELKGGSRIDTGGGINVMLRPDAPGQLRVGVELLAPIYQDLHGPQLETDVRIVTGVQLLF
jgi:hypothetical protein